MKNVIMFYVMIRRPPISTRTDTLFPYTTLFRSLRASHIKPWSKCASGDERVDGNNGLLLSPTADHLFDRGWITFEDDGALEIGRAPSELQSLMRISYAVSCLINNTMLIDSNTLQAAYVPTITVPRTWPFPA